MCGLDKSSPSSAPKVRMATTLSKFRQGQKDHTQNAPPPMWGLEHRNAFSLHTHSNQLVEGEADTMLVKAMG